MEEPAPYRVGSVLRMKKRPQRAKRSPNERVVTAPLWPAHYCLECRKMLPDIIKKDGKWVRPGKRRTCSKECTGKSMSRGGLSWIKAHHPEILHLFS